MDAEQRCVPEESAWSKRQQWNEFMETGKKHEDADNNAECDDPATENDIHHSKGCGRINDASEVTRIALRQWVDPRLVGRIERRRSGEGWPEGDVQACDERVRPRNGGETKHHRK